MIFPVSYQMIFVCIHIIARNRGFGLVCFNNQDFDSLMQKKMALHCLLFLLDGWHAWLAQDYMTVTNAHVQ